MNQLLKSYNEICFLFAVFLLEGILDFYDIALLEFELKANKQGNMGKLKMGKAFGS